MSWKFILLVAFLLASVLAVVMAIVGVAFFLLSASMPPNRSAEKWQSESWMGKDAKLPEAQPSHLLAMTDLPPLDPPPTPTDMVDAITKSRNVGCNAAVLSFSWPSLEPKANEFTLEELKNSVTLNEGRILFLGIQVINTTVKDLPSDLQDRPFDDPTTIRRFCSFLDGIAPLLKNRVRFLSIGNESDVYLAANPNELKSFKTFLNAARKHAKSIAPQLTVSTTLTDRGARSSEMKSLVVEMDAHFLTYYHGQIGLSGKFKNAETTTSEIISLADQLDDRPIVFQEIGFPADPNLASPQQQAKFVDGVFDAWEQQGERVGMINYFMMYDFPPAFVREQVNYYGVSDESKALAQFLGSLGLHEANGTARPSWEVFKRRATKLLNQ